MYMYMNVYNDIINIIDVELYKYIAIYTCIYTYTYTIW